MNDVMSVEEACELVGCRPCTLLAGLRSGAYPGVKVGKGWLVPRQALVERLNELARMRVEKKRTPQPRAGRRRPLLSV